MEIIRMKIHQIVQTRRPLNEPVGACEPHVTGNSRTAPTGHTFVRVTALHLPLC
jgi:hypothetical protein